MRGRLVVIALAAFAVAIVVAFSARAGRRRAWGRGPRSRRGRGRAAAHLRPLDREGRRSSAPLVDGFNAAHVRSRAAGSCTSEALSVASGEAETRIAAGRLRPSVWSPASSLWGRLLNFDANARMVARGQPVAGPHAAGHRDVGDVRARARLAEASRSAGSRLPAPRAARGEGLGALRQDRLPGVQARPYEPRLLDDGLSAVVGEYYAATGKREGLTLADVDRPAVRRDDPRPRGLDRPLRLQRRRSSPNSCSARPRVRAGHRDGGDDAARLQPASAATAGRSWRSIREGGTFSSDNPVRSSATPMGHAPSCAPPARRFTVPGSAPARRPSSRPTLRLPARATRTRRRRRRSTRAHGADPAQPERVSRCPPPRPGAPQEALAPGPQAGQRDARRRHVRRRWREERRLEQAKRGLRGVLSTSSRARTASGWSRSPRRIRTVVPLGAARDNAGELETAADGLVPVRRDGPLRRGPRRRSGGAPPRGRRERINAVVLLTDGMTRLRTCESTTC